MDALHMGIITLLRSALNVEKLTLPESFDWDEAMPLIYGHQLTGLAIQGATLCGIPRSHPAISRLMISFCKILQESRNQMKNLEDVCALFDANGIEYLPVKGAVIKAFYPRPEYRLMGDADILIRPEQYPLIQTLLPSLDMRELDNCDYEYTWESPALTLELHRYLVSTHFRNYFDYYRDSWRFAIKNDSGAGFHLSPEDHLVYFVAHFSKHYLNGSISAKDICDFYVWRRAHPDMNEAYIFQELKKLRLETFYRNILALLEHWFAGASATREAELITRSAFQGGVHQEFDHSAAENVMQRHASEGDSLFTKKAKWFFHALFPSRKVLLYRHPILKKIPVLLPVIWLRRWLEAVFCNRSKLRRGMIVANMNARSVSEYDAHIEAVGLDNVEQD